MKIFGLYCLCSLRVATDWARRHKWIERVCVCILLRTNLYWAGIEYPHVHVTIRYGINNGIYICPPCQHIFRERARERRIEIERDESREPDWARELLCLFIFLFLFFIHLHSGVFSNAFVATNAAAVAATTTAPRRTYRIVIHTLIVFSFSRTLALLAPNNCLKRRQKINYSG